ncbi:hypothetical protein [Actinoplanes friuliensis]|jgi:hypothetical protein|uniref:Integral membrane protein n=1 Tax=Actinoplanes friuliensis DSM 7358 TaxID=1246995 RepID=U5VT06_9ACTN|nr:hypothetical protein [Actinoplanes friuliensis]AGZ39999.1 hypothetical protein AFR_08550 [Actinoplanes friuliensis DSM 7358]
MPAQADLPLRPMTLGELLDAAMALLRARAVPLIGTAAVLALLEQALLVPLRTAAFATPPYYGPARTHFGVWWSVTSVGFATEAFVLTLVGALAAAAAGPALIGRAVPHRELWLRTRPLATICIAVLLGVAGGAGFFFGVVPWLICYGLFGLTAAVLIIDRSANPFTALVRSAKLAARGGLRGFWTLLAAYITWFAIRFALGSGWVSLLKLISGGDPRWLAWITPAAYTLANAVAYAALACVAAVLLLETRIRTEGLDLAISRARARGEDDADPLVYAR